MFPSYSRLILTFLLISSSLTKNQLKPGTPTNQPFKKIPPKCNQALIKSFGLQGIQVPSKYPMKMCPDIKKSCCRVSDQIEIYGNWEVNQENIDLQERLESHVEVYEGILDTAQSIQKRSNYLLQKLNPKMFSNCKVLAQKIGEYKIEHVSEIIKRELSEFHQFLATSHKGFYCSLCDLNSQSAFNTDLGKISYTRKFCRQLTSRSFHFLIYFQVHMIKYVNLLTRFLSYCDGKGKFNEVNIESDHIMLIEPHRQNMLEACRDHRDQPAWMEYCQPICDQFNPIKFSAFFSPQLDKYRKVLARLRVLMVKFDLPPLEDEDSDTDPEQENTSRPTRPFKGIKKAHKLHKLKSTLSPLNLKTQQANPLQKKKEKFGSNSVIKSQTMNSFNLEAFKNLFLPKQFKGINFYSVGKYSQFTDLLNVRIGIETKGEIEIQTSGGMTVIYPVIDQEFKDAVEAQKKQELENGKEPVFNLIQKNVVNDDIEWEDSVNLCKMLFGIFLVNAFLFY